MGGSCENKVQILMQEHVGTNRVLMCIKGDAEMCIGA